MEDINISKVSRDSNPNLGNGLVASVDLDPGVVIIQISDPYIITVQNAALGQVCSFCFVSTEALKKCSGCKVDQYCSITCQQASWKKVHKQECAILKKLPKVPPTPVRALMQVLLKRNSAAEIPPWTSLEAHREELMKHMRWDAIVLQAKAASSYVPGWSDKLEIVVAVACRVSRAHMCVSELHRNLLVEYRLLPTPFVQHCGRIHPLDYASIQHWHWRIILVLPTRPSPSMDAKFFYGHWMLSRKGNRSSSRTSIIRNVVKQDEPSCRIVISSVVTARSAQTMTALMSPSRRAM